MDVLINLASLLLFLFMILLLARVVLSLVISLSRDWHPKGAGLVATEGVFTVTDPPLKALRKIIPPLSIGQIRLDLAFLVLFFAVSIAWQVLNGL
ncbi:YggT family protein [Demequina sp.]|uniref:YggT family protein n=1 Tax=Demequina sp. TaxID=2050685 RepID=UPI003D0BA91E